MLILQGKGWFILHMSISYYNIGSWIMTMISNKLTWFKHLCMYLYLYYMKIILVIATWKTLYTYYCYAKFNHYFENWQKTGNFLGVCLQINWRLMTGLSLMTLLCFELLLLWWNLNKLGKYLGTKEIKRIDCLVTYLQRVYLPINRLGINSGLLTIPVESVTWCWTSISCPKMHWTSWSSSANQNIKNRSTE